MTTSENVVSFQFDESVLVLDSSDSCTTLNRLKTTELFTLDGWVLL